MRQFIIKTLFFILILSLVFVLIFIKADGYTDPYYKRFTTDKKSNLILGTSRSAQGIQPSILTKTIGKEFFNYSFTIGNSPYGSVYLKSIKKKLNEENHEGIFIVSVDPWSISTPSKNPNDIKSFKEKDRFLGNTRFVNMNPNFEYLLKNLTSVEYVRLFFGSMYSNLYLHDDGWLEVSLEMDSASQSKRKSRKMKEYNRNLSKYKFSEVRLNSLKETVEYLKNYGEVFLVRLPISPEIFEIEKQLMPDFEQKIGEIINSSDGYLDLTGKNKDYLYTDGNHIYKESGRKITEEIATWISLQSNNKVYRARTE